MKKIIYLSLILALIISINLSVLATGSLSDIDSQIYQAESELNQIQVEKSLALKEIEDLTNQIADLETQISDLNLKLENLNTEIQTKQKDIEDKQKEYEERQALLDKRLVAVYTTGKTSYLDVLLRSSSITDFISNYYLIEQLTEYDSELLNQIQNLKKQVEKEKTELEANKVEVEATKTSIEQNKISLENAKSEKTAKVESLSEEEKKIQADLDEFEKDKQEILEEAERAAKEAAANMAASGNSVNVNLSGNYTAGSVSTGGFICPVPGRSKADITTGFYGYVRHNGVDFARNSKGAVQGLPVIAAKAGVVSKSLAKKNSSGKYISYGEYIQINHADGTSTLYAHMQPGSRKVEKGDYVAQGQQIGNIGMTGNATGYHLHFEILYGKTHLDPSRYLP